MEFISRKAEIMFKYYPLIKLINNLWDLASSVYHNNPVGEV